MSGTRTLIVNADDMGQSAGVNRGIIAAHEKGIVRSASLMVRGAAAGEAAAYAAANGGLDLGLHFDLGEWAFRGGTWQPVYEVVDPEDRALVAEDLIRQIEAFRDLTGTNPTHLDSHQHVHLREPLRPLFQEIADRLEVPLRRLHPLVHYCGDFYGQTEEGLPLSERLTVDALVRILSSLPPGVTELVCHPGEGNDVSSAYGTERAVELGVLCDPRVRTAIGEMKIEVSSFRGILDRLRGAER
ncbi:MAG: ChbG/HpnK family deacetylase [Candidatus Eisenbacteria bacterium]